MKNYSCKCRQCQLAKQHTNKNVRGQKLEVRAARSRARQILRTRNIDYIEAKLPHSVTLDYLA